MTWMQSFCSDWFRRITRIASFVLCGQARSETWSYYQVAVSNAKTKFTAHRPTAATYIWSRRDVMSHGKEAGFPHSI
eukprot:scaffold3651_cov104-Cylindrotheca_fusiformis.AAC.3